VLSRISGDLDAAREALQADLYAGFAPGPDAPLWEIWVRPSLIP